MPTPFFYAPTIPESGMQVLVGAIAASWVIPLLTVILAVAILVMLVRTRRAIARLEDRVNGLSTAATTADTAPGSSR